MGTQGPNRKVANSLLALSSAAILGVYSAGYVRTRAAAQRFAAQGDARRPASGAQHTSPTLETRDASQSPQQSRAASSAAHIDLPRPTVRRRRERKLPDDARMTANPPAHAAMPAVASPSATGAAADAPAEPSAPATPAAPAPAAPASVHYLDGTYFGWGTSRHGDIQAAVIVEGGRIASATIAQCLTRYSCSVIARLPPQVSERQSPEVDYVSGATQSTNAFYYAVVEALGHAKAK